MSWDTTIYEYAKFREPHRTKQSELYQTYEMPSLLYCQPDWDSIEEYTNDWNKQRRRIYVYEIMTVENSNRTSDKMIDIPLHLDMGARLFNAMKLLAKKKPKFVKILKLSNPRDKFDVMYYVDEYNFKTQEKITKPKPK